MRRDAFRRPFTLPPRTRASPLAEGRTYWYASDGNTYTLYALLESAPVAGKTCPSVPKELAGIANVYCVSGP